jgi:hypothetical protein
MNITGVSYQFRRDEFPDKNFLEGSQIGFIAQHVELTIPEIVLTDQQGWKSVQYSALIPVLVEAIKEQDAQIKEQELINKQQEVQIKQQEAQIKEEKIVNKQQEVQIKQQETQIKEQEVVNKQQEAQIKKQKIVNKQQGDINRRLESAIEQLTKQMQELIVAQV